MEESGSSWKSRAGHGKVGLVVEESVGLVVEGDSCCTPDVLGIIMSIFMQDGPFLVLRMLLIFKYSVLPVVASPPLACCISCCGRFKYSVFSYTNMFFTCKNTLVCMLLMYRLIVIQASLSPPISLPFCDCRVYSRVYSRKRNASLWRPSVRMFRG